MIERVTYPKTEFTKEYVQLSSIRIYKSCLRILTTDYENILYSKEKD